MLHGIEARIRHKVTRVTVQSNVVLALLDDAIGQCHYHGTMMIRIHIYGHLGGTVTLDELAIHIRGHHDADFQNQKNTSQSYQIPLALNHRELGRGDASKSWNYVAMLSHCDTMNENTFYLFSNRHLTPAPERQTGL
jgi:hypothetical protein